MDVFDSNFDQPHKQNQNQWTVGFFFEDFNALFFVFWHISFRFQPLNIKTKTKLKYIFSSLQLDGQFSIDSQNG